MICGKKEPAFLLIDIIVHFYCRSSSLLMDINLAEVYCSVAVSFFGKGYGKRSAKSLSCGSSSAIYPLKADLGLYM
jgi:hypothetical protein